MKGKENYRNGVRFFNFQKSLDYQLRKIDERAERQEANADYHQDENATGRVWHF